MADPGSAPDASVDSDADPRGGAATGTPRWQMVIGILGLVVAVWVGSETYTVVTAPGGGAGGDLHGPGGDTPAPGVTEGEDGDPADQPFDPADLEGLDPDEIREFFEDLHG